MQIVKTKLCRGIIIALESYYRTIRKIMGRLNYKKFSFRQNDAKCMRNQRYMLVSEIMYYIFSRPRSKVIIEPLKITVDYREDRHHDLLLFSEALEQTPFPNILGIT